MALYLDTETTGFSAAQGDTIVELAILDEQGRVLIDTLVDPRRSIPWYASQANGITDDMVRGQPTLKALWPRVREIIGGQELVIYNAVFDSQFFPGRLGQAKEVSCAMRRFAEVVGSKPKSLDMAARQAKHRWTGDKHRARSDADACRSVWLWLRSKSES
jgi:DNA polymerase III subunit epsilon